jgi:hypothetical protein
MATALGAADVRAAETREATAGAEYAAGAWFRFLFGSGYRDLWTTPIRAPVLDPATEAGGLAPVRQVGEKQTLALALRGRDGRDYTFRSLQKHPDRILPPEWRAGFPGYIVRDATSGTHPAAGVIVPALSEAAGVAAAPARLVILADHASLGPFRETFANQLGTFAEHPRPAGPASPGFRGVTEILSTRELWTLWMQGPETRVDSRAYLRARTLELWLDDYDRHGGQWRWMRLPDEARLQPLPEDPDMALLHHDGVVKAGLRAYVPRLLRFTESYPSRLDGPLMNAWALDRWLLADLGAADFEEVARDLQRRLDDTTIEGALRRMPPEWYAISGSRTLAALVARRDGLVEYMRRVYRYYAERVDVRGSDRAESVTVDRSADGAVEVTLALDEAGAGPHYRRRFAAGETKEVRVYLHGGDDRVRSAGPRKGPILVRVIAGGGRKRIDDTRGGGIEVWPDVGTVEVQPGPGTRVCGAGFTAPDAPPGAPWWQPRSFGHWTVPYGIVWWTPDVEFLVGAGFTRTSWGFRSEPERMVQTVRAAFATGDTPGKVEYLGTVRRAASPLGLRLHAYASGIERVNFFGFGNDTPDEPDRDRYRSDETEAFLNPSLLVAAGRHVEAALGADVRYSSSSQDAVTILGEAAPYGTGSFGSLGLRAELRLDTRARPRHSGLGLAEDVLGPEDHTRASVRVRGLYVPEVWDADDDYGGVDGEAVGYLGSSRAHLALRAGGALRWGRYAWFDAAFLGGSIARGFRSNRFAGDGSLYANAELRLWFGTLRNPVLPLRLGAVALADTGRVWLAGESSTTWHHSYGGGLLFQPLGFPITGHATLAWSDEGTRFYFGSGYSF